MNGRRVVCATEQPEKASAPTLSTSIAASVAVPSTLAGLPRICRSRFRAKDSASNGRLCWRCNQQETEMKMRYLPLALSLMFSPVIAAHAQISVAIGFPGVNIGIDMPMYPQMVQVPGYPVYYDPGARSNYFFYDGAYWVYQRDNWYASTWYNGPWQEVSPDNVPLFVLRVPVRYYREPPSYFRGWGADAAPRWGDRWGQRWSSQHNGWDRWNRNSAPRAAPLPTYQRQYFGARYPRTTTQQTSIRTRDYRYQPREAVTRQVQQRRSTRVRAVPLTQQRAQAQRTEKTAQARQAQTLQRSQTRQREQARQTDQRAQAERAQSVQRAQTQQRAQAQRTEKTAQARQAQTLQRS
ncbi:MAG: hypothetical protein EPN38_06040, partial [Rhodanobacteraceae bacterium]